MNYTYETKGTCSTKIQIATDENKEKIVNVKFFGGCDGNTKGLCAILKGMDIGEAIRRLKGIDCRNRGTSCPDQLAIALENIRAADL